ncbi:hypothetical protein V6N12_049263 [Hibiscus sabdariffa]|uniref:Uncharacterized protein n=1 Tax=Hibiscus sabdariffa TaxID=183260 RepID=A0ABR2ENG3_9ROSI
MHALMKVGQISQILNTRPIGGFPSNTEVAKGATHEKCKAITTKSGKVLIQTSNQRGTATSTSAATDTPAVADEPAKTSVDHGDPHNKQGGVLNRINPLPAKRIRGHQTTPTLSTKAEEAEAGLPVKEVL